MGVSSPLCLLLLLNTGSLERWRNVCPPRLHTPARSSPRQDQHLCRALTVIVWDPLISSSSWRLSEVEDIPQGFFFFIPFFLLIFWLMFPFHMLSLFFYFSLFLSSSLLAKHFLQLFGWQVFCKYSNEWKLRPYMLEKQNSIFSWSSLFFSSEVIAGKKRKDKQIIIIS